MDSWFTHAPLIGRVVQRGLHVIGMVKNDSKRYLIHSKQVDLKGLYRSATQVQGKQRSILRQIHTELVPGIPVVVVFVRHHSKKNEWLAILSTDLTLTATEIIQIYALRWDIEVFFICTKLVELMNEIANQVGKKLSAMIKSQLQHLIAALPNYIKGVLADFRLRKLRTLTYYGITQ